MTGLLIVDPYNDFISEGGKVWSRVKEVAQANGCVRNMARVLDAARSAGLPVFFAPHRRWRKGDFEGWRSLAPNQARAAQTRVFEFGSWGGEFREEFSPRPGEVVAAEHWLSSGFMGTDLDLQLRERGVEDLIVAGLLANTCIDSTVRHAAELGYDVTLVSDAIASLDWGEMKATLDLNAPHYTQAILTTEQLLERRFQHARIEAAGRRKSRGRDQNVRRQGVRRLRREV